MDRGELPPINHRDLVDKVAAVAQLIDRIPTDIARYGEQMHANTAALLRQSLSDDSAEFAESLQRMFDGHDVIAESAEGQAFRAFATVVATPSQRSQLEADIAEITARVLRLPPHLRDALAGFIDAMWQRVQEVEDVRAMAFRRMSTFVRGGDALHYRSMRVRVGEAQAAAAEAFQHTHGGRDIGFVVPMSGVNAASVGRLRLHPGTALVPDPVRDSSREFDIDPSALGGDESINWTALRPDRRGGKRRWAESRPSCNRWHRTRWSTQLERSPPRNRGSWPAFQTRSNALLAFKPAARAKERINGAPGRCTGPRGLRRRGGGPAAAAGQGVAHGWARPRNRRCLVRLARSVAPMCAQVRESSLNSC